VLCYVENFLNLCQYGEGFLLVALWESSHSIGSQGCESPRGEAPIQTPPTTGLPWPSLWPLKVGRGDYPPYSTRCRIHQASLAPITGLSRSSAVSLQDNYSLVQAPNGANDHSIFIYSLSRCWYTLGFSNWLCIKGDMPPPRIETPGGSLCPALSQGNAFFYPS
jgi:hypothetical protein